MFESRGRPNEDDSTGHGSYFCCLTQSQEFGLALTTSDWKRGTNSCGPFPFFSRSEVKSMIGWLSA